MALVKCSRCGAENELWSKELTVHVESKAKGEHWHGLIVCKKCGEMIDISPDKEKE